LDKIKCMQSDPIGEWIYYDIEGNIIKIDNMITRES